MFEESSLALEVEARCSLLSATVFLSESFLAVCLGGLTELPPAFLAEDSAATLAILVMALPALAVFELAEERGGATEADLLILAAAILVSILRAAFLSRARTAYEALGWLLLLPPRATAIVLLFFANDCCLSLVLLRRAVLDTVTLLYSFLGGDADDLVAAVFDYRFVADDVAAYLAAFDSATVVLEVFSCCEAPEAFLGGDAPCLALDWLRLARRSGEADACCFLSGCCLAAGADFFAAIVTDFLGACVPLELSFLAPDGF